MICCHQLSVQEFSSVRCHLLREAIGFLQHQMLIIDLECVLVSDPWETLMLTKSRVVVFSLPNTAAP